jgi:hypothetical protein
MPELFPTALRGTSHAISYQFTVALLGGMTPFVCHLAGKRFRVAPGSRRLHRSGGNRRTNLDSSCPGNPVDPTPHIGRNGATGFPDPAMVGD